MKPKVLFLHQSWQGFERRDFQILERHFATDELLIRRDFLFKIIQTLHAIKKADIVFCWFAYQGALLALLLAKLFRKKIIVVAGGWESANLVEINYGAMRRGIKFLPTRIVTQLIVRLANKIVTVSEHNSNEVIRNLKVPPNKIHLIYHGVPITCCKPDFVQKENIVLTVGEVKRSNLKRKGIETFIEAAEALPNINFIIVGAISKDMQEYLNWKTPKNLKITGYINEADLHKYYQRAKVYAQLSYHEQFGCALAEAMAHQCVPVVTAKAALPEIVGETGYYVPYGNITKTTIAVSEALRDNKKGGIARERIVKFFSLERRQQSLVALLKGLK
jgi:glycosyltransferase involved in cell wall biosynthesis